MIDLAPEEIALAIAVLEQRRARWDPLEGLFEQQREFILDPEKRKTALCSRRAGKTTTAERYLAQEAQKPDSICVYVGLTRLNAKRALWGPLQALNQRQGLGWTFQHTELAIRTPEGGQIWLVGMDDESQIEKLRGFRFRLALIDEAGSYPGYLRKLVDEVISPALLDQDGTLCLLGTPSARLSGVFHEATTTAQGWSRHHWNTLHNPYLPNAAQWIEAEKARRGWTEQSPGFLREFRGLWIRSEGELIYHYDPALNDIDIVPRLDHHVLAVDLGFRDATAYVIAGYREHDPNLYFVHAEPQTGWIPSKIAARIQELRAEFKTEALILDCGALGLSIAEEFRQRYSLPVEAAEKREKATAIELFNGDMRLGRIKCPADSPLVEEWRTLQFDKHGKEDPSQANNLCDAALYGFRRAFHYLARPLAPPLPDAERIAVEIERSIRASLEPDPNQLDTSDYSGWGH